MSMLQHVSVAKQANVYFNGKVTSRSVVFADGTRQTLGVVVISPFLTEIKSRYLGH
ncbi:hypothetical protein GCM10009347_23940 [Shewanella algicola]|nr:hypothetical protein GCM10009347_23940 [Shewanella algicola]